MSCTTLKPTQVTSSATQEEEEEEEEEEATTTGRMDYTLSGFHVVHCNVNCVWALVTCQYLNQQLHWALTNLGI